MSARGLRALVTACAVALALGCAAPRAAFAAGGGSMVLDSLTESFEQSGAVVILSGTITNECAATLPAGSALEFAFDDVTFAGFTLSALANGQQQTFSVYGTLPANLPAPKKNRTSLDFTITLPKAPGFGLQGAPKTSTCLVTFAQGTPPAR